MSDDILGPPAPSATPQRNFVVFDAMGRIWMAMYADPGIAALNVPAGKNLLMVQADVSVDSHYVLNGEAVLRPANTAQLLGRRLVNLPMPCTISINGQRYACHDDHADLEFDQPGTYRISVSAWPLMDVEFIYENPAS